MILLAQIDTVALVAAILGGCATIVGAIFKGLKMLMSRMPDPKTFATKEKTDKIELQLLRTAEQLGELAKCTVKLEAHADWQRQVLEETRSDVRTLMDIAKRSDT